MLGLSTLLRKNHSERKTTTYRSQWEFCILFCYILNVIYCAVGIQKDNNIKLSRYMLLELAKTKHLSKPFNHTNVNPIDVTLPASLTKAESFTGMICNCIGGLCPNYLPNGLFLPLCHHLSVTTPFLLLPVSPRT